MEEMIRQIMLGTQEQTIEEIEEKIKRVIEKMAEDEEKETDFFKGV